MAESSYPFDSQTVSEDQWSAMMRRVTPTGVRMEAASTLELSTAVGLNVSLGIGEAMVRGHFYDRDAAGDLVITANSSGNDRIDLVVLKLDPTANSVVAAVLAGTPAGSPVAPTPTQTDAGVYEMPLHEVYVIDGATGFVGGDFTDARVFPARDCLEGSALPEGSEEAPEGTLYRRLGSGLGDYEYVKAAGSGFDNTGWAATARSDTGHRDLGGGTPLNSWTFIRFTLRRVGGIVTMTVNASAVSATSDAFFTLPAGFRPPATMEGTSYSVSHAGGRIFLVTNAGSCSFYGRGSGSHYWSGSWSTEEAWPTSLPGS